MDFIITLISTILVNNVVLSGYKGLCSYIGLSNNWKSSIGMGMALTLVCFLTGLICWGLSFITAALDVSYLNTVVFILVIASFVQMLEIIMKRFLPSLYKSLGIYLPLITTNCVVLGLAISVSSMGGTQWQDVLANCLGVPLGYFMVLVIFSAMQQRLAIANPFRTFKGQAISFIATAFMAMAFMGFSGLLS